MLLPKVDVPKIQIKLVLLVRVKSELNYIWQDLSANSSWPEAT